MTQRGFLMMLKNGADYLVSSFIIKVTAGSSIVRFLEKRATA
jgi:hypothetical protein